jgi:ETC complex I subunit conserved region
MTARLYRPAKTAMQSGTAKTGRWLLEFVPDAQARSIEPLMGWTSSVDTLAQVKLWFETKEEAIAYAAKNGIACQVEEPQEALRRPMAYSDNFKSDRIGTWTH